MKLEIKGDRNGETEEIPFLDIWLGCRYEFERDIAKGAVNKRTGQVVAERMLRYIEDKVRAKVRAVDRIHVKRAQTRARTDTHTHTHTREF